MQKILFGLGLLVALAPACFAPPAAQAATRTLSCDATIPLRNGASFTYKVTGSIELDSAGQLVPPVAEISGLLMTVQRRDRTGRTQTLLNRSPLANLEQIAPDADYSRLPFSGRFRGQPNNGQGLYSVTSSAHGLYASLRPSNGFPQQLQVVHYPSAGQFVRSVAGTCRAVE